LGRAFWGDNSPFGLFFLSIIYFGEDTYTSFAIALGTLFALLAPNFWDGFSSGGVDIWMVLGWGGMEWYGPHIKRKCVILICLLFSSVVGIEGGWRRESESYGEKFWREDGWNIYVMFG